MADKIINLVSALLVTIIFGFFGLTGEPSLIKGFLAPAWVNLGVGIVGLIVSIVIVRDIIKARKNPKHELPNDEELAADLARQEQLYFEEHGETPAETTARLLKEKRERKERKSRKS